MSNCYIYKNCNNKITFAPVKLVSIIFVFYVLLLSVQPCCAEDNCQDDEHSPKTEQAAHTRHHDKDCNGDCSPFFTCGTCAGGIYHTVTVSLEPQTIIFTNLVSIYNPSFFSAFHCSIWQPTKIS